MRAALRFFACALMASSAVGCGDIDGGSAQFPGTILYQDPAGAFEFRMLQPPWIPPFVHPLLPDVTFSVVPPPDATVSADPTVLLGEALYSLQFSKVTGDPASAMASVKGTIAGGGMSVATEEVTAASGSTGVEMAWQEAEGMFHRDAFLASSGTPTFRLHFTSKKEITDDDMVAQMITSFRAK
jgi:hypothetical protein